jgi:hypothetical protein
MGARRPTEKVKQYKSAYNAPRILRGCGNSQRFSHKVR